VTEVAAIEKVPPQSIEAEQSTLGSMLIEREATARVEGMLLPADFYREAHQQVFNAITDLFERGEPADLLTITEELRQRGALDRVGGAQYLTSLIEMVPTAANVEYYAQIVKERSILRQLIYAGTSIASQAYEEGARVEEVMNKAEELVFQVAHQRMSQDFQPLQSILVTAYEEIERLYEKKAHITGLPSGFRDLDYITAGLQPADLVVIAGRPSMGKTALCLNIAQHVAVREKRCVGVFSMEMAREQLAQRLLCAEAMVDASRLRSGRLDDGDWQRLSRAIGALNEARIFIDDTPALTVMELRSKARRLKMRFGLDLLVIDYLQLIHSSGRARYENRNQEISEISRALKALAKELRIPVVALSQLSRAVESRPNKRPMLSDLRESGAIEQEADVVGLIYRDEYYNEATEFPGVAEINVAKHRNGPTGTVNLVFLRQYAKFANLEKHLQDPVESAL